MPRPAAKLSNCYVPLPSLYSEASKKSPEDENSATESTQQQQHDGSSTRDGEKRATHSLRQLCIETAVTDSLGSALVELGHTKVLAEVTLTTLETSVHMVTNVEEGTLVVQVQFAPNVGVHGLSQRSESIAPLDSTVSYGKLNSQIMTKEADLSAHVSSALQPAILLDKYAKCILRIQLTILQDDGSSLSACISAATVALVEARVEIADVVASCTVAVNHNIGKKKNADTTVQYLADPTRNETSDSKATVVIAMMPNHREVTLWSQEGSLTADMTNQAINLCRDGCRTMHKFLREYWVSR